MSDEIRFGTDGWRAVIARRLHVRQPAPRRRRRGSRLRRGPPRRRSCSSATTRASRPARSPPPPPRCSPSHGLRVKVSDRYCPTPALCWSVARDDDAVGGVMLTASHNPAPYLGFKIRMADGGASPRRVHRPRRGRAARRRRPTRRGRVRDGRPRRRRTSTTSRRSWTPTPSAPRTCSVVVDPLYGAGQGYLAEMLRDARRRGHRDPRRAQPRLRRAAPRADPAAHRRGARARARRAAPRRGVHHRRRRRPHRRADRRGDFVNPHRIICLVARHLVEDKGMRGNDRQDAVHLGARRPPRAAPRPRGRHHARSGFKWIYEEMVNGDVLIGGEESGGIGIPVARARARRPAHGAAARRDDGAARHGPRRARRRPVRAHRPDGVRPRRPAARARGQGRVRGRGADDGAGRPRRARRSSDIVRADGVKFLLPDDAWLLLRPSGTEPLVRVYAEASSAGVVDDLLAAGRALVLGRA